MRAPTFRADNDDAALDLDASPAAVLVTGRALVSALRRTWPLWCAAALIGALLGMGAFRILPRPFSATATLLMVSPNPDDSSAMTTDVTLLQTRAVGARVVEDLGLRESPEQFLSSVTATPVSSQILKVEVGAATSDEAVSRTTSLVDNFLAFRTEQLQSISGGLVDGYTKRVTALQSEIAELTRQYRRLSAQPAPDQVLVSDIVSRRAALGAEVTELQRSIEDAHLRADAAISATHVLDEAGTKPSSSRREAVVVPVAGAIVGGGLAIGTILFTTLTSDRLRRRRDIAAALGVPVLVSVGRVGAWWRRRSAGALAPRSRGTSGTVARHAHPTRGRGGRSWRLEALVHGLGHALPPRLHAVLRRADSPSPGAAHGQGTRPRGAGSAAGGLTAGAKGATGRRPPRPCTIGVVGIDRPRAAAALVAALGNRLATEGVPVLLVDLTSSGALTGPAPTNLAGTSAGGPGSPGLYRPAGNPALIEGPQRGGSSTRGEAQEVDGLHDLWEQAEVVLVLLEVDPGVDLGIVATWVTQVVPLVSAGSANRDLLETVTALVTRSGVLVPFALLEGADRTDRTLGRQDEAADEQLPAKVASSR